MKSVLLRAERALLGLAPVRFAVRAVCSTGFRLRWLWGRIRFGALVPHRGLGCVCAWDADLKYPGNIRLGDRVIIGSNVPLSAQSPIDLGDQTRIPPDSRASIPIWIAACVTAAMVPARSIRKSQESGEPHAQA